MWAEINGERKKVACGPCIRGHRSSKCDHRDRVLIEVRKPGRPLSSCPHPSGSCSCERVVINYTIPKTSECACPSDRTQSATSATGASNRVQKSRNRKSTNTFNPSSLEKAIKASQDAETDSSSLVTQTPTNPSFAPSEKSTSNGASPPSSTSSTPRILPSPPRKQSYNSDVQLADAPTVRPSTSNSREISDCCKSKAPEPAPQQQSGSCCGNKAREVPQQAPVMKSCCSGSSQPSQVNMFTQMNSHPNATHSFPQFPPFQQPGQFQNPSYGTVNQGLNYNIPGNMTMGLPFGFNTPIYNHMASGYQQSGSMPMTAAHNGAHCGGSHGTEHNCHCGDSCSCFGCAAHPNNATMTEYLRLMHHYMNTGGFGALPPPTYDLPVYPHHPGFGAETAQNMAFGPTPQTNGFAPFGSGQLNFQATMNATMSIPDTPVTATSHWQQTPAQASVQPHSAMNSQYFSSSNNAQETSMELKTEEPDTNTAIADSPSDGKDEDTPTLSPSSYFWQELVLPGCNDATGTCQCGDGCECVGCLTHGGHNGVPLNPPTASEQDAFNEFFTNNNLGDNSPNVMTGTYSEAPT